MRLTIISMLCAGIVLVSLIATARAQSSSTDYTSSGSCKPDAEQRIPAGDKPGHEFAVTRGSCTTNTQIAGMSAKLGTYAERDDITPTKTEGRGIYTETYDNGDKLFYDYKVTLTTSGGVVRSGKGKFKAIGGTGKMAAIKAKGTCTYTAGPGGGANYQCTGQYSSK